MQPRPADAGRVLVTVLPDRRHEIEDMLAPLGQQLSAIAADMSDHERRRLIAFTKEAAHVLTTEARRIRYRLD